ncbi:thiamine pyrophosphate-dependent dehydrogenase E1 component subunit alpha [Sporosarcina obsidiansis]|uniref:thiamine pyrophosphate-dependent dehydrogenase E1 component subunit alpha n=1 Tax=Sporosarcina obsidiansis TaxID=2660748 RepID=UPI00129A5275|nr:thiamine pyrophosphate-dependent dehydrogenase E1 component subunit alpha [Sporosarcina obsidiansis]
MTVPVEQLKWMYKTMYKSRHYEETLYQAYFEGKLPGFDLAAGPIPGEMHLSAGQEPAAVGICAHLREEDIVNSPHRPHHHAIAKGVDLNRMTAEIYGKITGLGKGKGGHMHLFDPAVKFSCGGIVGAGLPQAVGAALSSKMKKKDWVTVVFIGEGAVNSGAFHESLNMAALWKLPLVVVIEDNNYGISVSKAASTSVASNAERAVAYGIPGVLVKDNDPIEMYHASQEAIERAKRGEGPTIIEIETYRYLGHFVGDTDEYRDPNELQKNREKDPIPLMKAHLLQEGVASEVEIAEMEGEARQLVHQAFDFARNSADPALETALEDVFN